MQTLDEERFQVKAIGQKPQGSVREIVTATPRSAFIPFAVLCICSLTSAHFASNG